MPRFVRKQVYLRAEQETALKRLARRRGTTEAAIIREALTRELEHAAETARRRSALRDIETCIARLVGAPSARISNTAQSWDP